MSEGIDWMSDSFALRPPAGTRRQTAALHWTSRLRDSDAGSHAKLCPLSYRGPRGCSMVELTRHRSWLTSIISGMRQGNSSMQRFPFVNTKREAIGGTSSYSRRSLWGTCRLCHPQDGGPQYDLWHVLFECPATSTLASTTAIVANCRAFVPKLCELITDATMRNASSMSNTENFGVDHIAIHAAVRDVLTALQNYQWDCVPGQWITYTILLALPFPEKVVRPDAQNPIWKRPSTQKRKRNGVTPALNLHGMPTAVPDLPPEQYALPEALGRLYDCTILSSDSLRPLADSWCSLARGNLLRAGATVRPLRAAADVLLQASSAIQQQQPEEVDSELGSINSDNEPESD